MRDVCFALALLLSLSSNLGAQDRPNLTGHWEGIVAVPAGDVTFEVDLTKNAAGQLVGTITQPAQKIKGLPLSRVAVEGASVTFAFGNARFDGTLLPGGTTISGDFAGPFQTVPFTLERKGEARIDAAPRNGPLPRQLEGAWHGALEADGVQMRVVLKLSNQPEGTSTATFVSVDENNLELPASLAQNGAELTLQMPMVGSAYSATLNAAATEMAGTYVTAHGVRLPLSLRREDSR